MVDDNKIIEIRNSSIIIPAILLLAVYFISDFLYEKKLVIAAIYIVILGLSIYLCGKKAWFYETIYNLIVLLILGELLKNCVPHHKNIGWIFETLMKQFKFSPELYIKDLLSTSYLYFYLLGIFLLFFCKFAPYLCRSYALKSLFNTLGNYSLWAIVISMCALCFVKYELIKNVIFFIFMISAFWTACTKVAFTRSDIVKSILLVFEVSVFILLFPKQYSSFVESFQSAKSITGIYSIGLFIICVLCILSDKVIQDIIIGFVIFGTNIMFLYGKLNHMMVSASMILLFHISAFSFYYVVKNVFALDNSFEKKQYLKPLLAASYMTAFLLTIFISNHYEKSIMIFCIGLLYAFIYFGNYFQIRGTFLGTVMYGAIPWILLETTMNSLGKMNASLLAVILFTILFWCTCSVALSWNDTAYIKAIAFEKAKSKSIINGLSGIAFLLTALVLFV